MAWSVFLLSCWALPKSQERKTIPWGCRLQGGWRTSSTGDKYELRGKKSAGALGRCEMTDKRTRCERKPVGGVKATLGNLGES